MTPKITAALTFLIQVFFNLYLMVLLLRFLLQWVRADFYNPLCQVVTKLTNPLVLPLRRWVPGLFGLDTSSALLWVLFSMLKIVLLSLLLTASVSLPNLIGTTVQNLITQVIQLYFYTILLEVILSWLSPASPLLALAHCLNEPFMARIRRFIPPIAGIDLSPMFAIIALQLLGLFIL